MTEPTASPHTATPAQRLAIDYGPLVVFFLVNFLAPIEAPIARMLTATGAFMAAQAAAMIASWTIERRIPAMLWITGGLVLGFGALTLIFQDQRFIQMKPTFVYLLFAATLAVGLATGRPLLKALLGTAYPGLTAEGWRKLTRNWALFFVAMAALNEAVWRQASFDFWVGFKLWGAVPLTLLFAILNVPMLLKHGLSDPTAPAAEPPAEG